MQISSSTTGVKQTLLMEGVTDNLKLYIMIRRNLIHQVRHKLSSTKQELFLIKTALEKEKDVVYDNSKEEIEEHHSKIDAILEQIAQII
jgi:hypothetical protein